MQMSRSVTIPTTRPSAFTTGRQPTSRSHIFPAATARLSSGPHVSTFGFMSCDTFMVVSSLSPLSGLRLLARGDGDLLRDRRGGLRHDDRQLAALELCLDVRGVDLVGQRERAREAAKR